MIFPYKTNLLENFLVRLISSIPFVAFAVEEIEIVEVGHIHRSLVHSSCYSRVFVVVERIQKAPFVGPVLL